MDIVFETQGLPPKNIDFRRGFTFDTAMETVWRDVRVVNGEIGIEFVPSGPGWANGNRIQDCEMGAVGNEV